MKSINSLLKWILFVPVCIMSVTITFFNGLFPGSVSEFFATTDNGVAGIVAFSVLGLFVFSFLISLFDRKISPVHMLRKNVFCGVMAVAAAITMAANAAFDLTSMINADEPFKVMTIITVLLTGVSGVAMLYLGLNHFAGANSKGKISLLYVSLPLWCGAHLIDRFLNNTATPVAAADTMDLIMFVAMAMFFINVTMIHSVIAVKNAVKSAVNFGLPAVVVALVFSVSEAFKAINSEEFIVLNLVPSIAYGFLALYALGFTCELSFKSKTVDEQVILETEEESTGFSDEYYSEEDEDITDTSLEDISLEDTFGSEPDEQDDYENMEEENSEEVTSKEETVTVSSAPEFPQIRIADEAEETSEKIEADANVTQESSEDTDVADELFKAAQQSDKKNSQDKQTANITEGSDDNMIIEGESEKVQPMKTTGNKTHSKLKGPTTREAIMYEDDDFILTVDKNDAPASSSNDEDDISAYIFDDHKENDSKKKTYEERLDEIDKLIISIQGGDSPEDK